ncbi:hypothetical protein LCGC14_0416690 [marine sediment metagenome]|uniref:Uncharacterized protein n=1 Tax=marine sediment metagenome TaxID=412755 RepID=A0A0F9SS75_9ZZZZ
MSSVTSTIILSLFANNHLEEINNYLKGQNHNAVVEIDCCSGGGEKCMSPAILMGGFNNMDIDAFIQFLKTLDWQSDAILVYCHDQEDFYSVIRLSKEKSPFRWKQ